MWSLGPMDNSLTHTQSRNLFPLWTTRKNASSKVKGHWPRFDSIVTKTTETKSGDHREITHGMVLKSTQAHKLHYFETLSSYPNSFREILNNLTSTKFTRFSASFLSRYFLSISQIIQDKISIFKFLNIPQNQWFSYQRLNKRCSFFHVNNSCIPQMRYQIWCIFIYIIYNKVTTQCF